MRFKSEPISSEALALDPRESEINLSGDISDFLADESKLAAPGVGKIYAPTSEAGLAAVLKHCSDKKMKVCVSGGRTGVVGGAVPFDADAVVSVDKIKGIQLAKNAADGNELYVTVGAGVRLAELNDFIQANAPEFFFPVNPTETWASVGGMVSTNASGSRSYHYGSVRNWVVNLKVVLIDGSCLNLSRSRDLNSSESKVEFTGTFGTRSVDVPFIARPLTKNAVGYVFDSTSEPVDLFIGAEGTLGVVSEVTLRLCKKPTAIFTYLQFFPDEINALNAVEAAKKCDKLEFLSLEFFCRNALRHFCSSAKGKTSKVLPLAEQARGAVQFKVDASNADLDNIIEMMTDIVGEAGADAAQSFAGFDEDVGATLRTFRHGIPEAINAMIAERARSQPGLHKLSTDMAVPDGRLIELFEMYQQRLSEAQLEFAIFGHAGDNHLHANILPKDLAELDRGKKLYFEFAKTVVEMGGAVSAEHGIGRIKRDFLKLQYSSEVVSNMREIKRLFDPDSLLNIGVLFYE